MINVDQDEINVDHDVVNVDHDEINVDQDVVNVDQDVVNVDQDVVNVDHDEINVDQDVVNVDHDEINVDHDEINVDHDAINVDQEAVNVDQTVVRRYQLMVPRVLSSGCGDGGGGTVYRRLQLPDRCRVEVALAARPEAPFTADVAATLGIATPEVRVDRDGFAASETPRRWCDRTDVDDRLGRLYGTSETPPEIEVTEADFVLATPPQSPSFCHRDTVP